MSRATESEHTLQRKAGSGAEHAPDLDAEHDPETARRASLAGMRQIAAELFDAPRASAAPAGGAKLEGKPSGASAEQQHEKAEDANYDGVKAALVLGAVRIHGHVVEIDRLIKPSSGEGGADLNIKIMQQLFSGASSDLERLAREVRSLDPIHRRHVHREVLRLAGAVERFQAAWGRAESYAADHGQKFDHRFNPYFLTQHVKGSDGLYEGAGLDKAVQADLSRDERKDGDILSASMNASLAAANASASAVQIELASGKGQLAGEDLNQLILHLKEVERSLALDYNGKLRSSFAGKLRGVVQAATAVQRAIANRPELDNFAKSSLASTVKNLDAYVSGR